MKTDFLPRNMVSSAFLTAIALTGCSSAAPDYHGRWKPVNHYTATTTAIPLAQSYEFYASPMDGTLKAMLTRWAKDTGITLAYKMPSDYTLSAPTAKVHSANLRTAASELNVIYAHEGVSIAVSDWQIVVQPLATQSASNPPPAVANPSTPIKAAK